MVRKIKKGAKIYVELPEDSEIIEVKDNILLVFVGNGNEDKQRTEKKLARPSEDEVLKKLYALPFKYRELSSLGGKFTKEEVSLLKKLMKDKKLYLHKKGGKKYIAFTDETFKKMRELAKPTSSYGGDVSYAIFTENEAKRFLERNGKRFVAIKHFDGRVYVAERGFLQRSAKKIKNILSEGPMHIDEISRKAEMDEKAVLVVLRLLNEGAEVIELKKDVFSLTE